MFNKPLQLTPHERQWNDYEDNGTKRGVILRRYTFNVTLDTASKAASVTFQTPRRCRVFQVTWSGDVAGARVNIRTSTGEKITVEPCHIPLLSGHGTRSMLSISPNIGAYPTAGADGLQPPPGWTFTFEPEIVLPGIKQLIFDYDLENPNDTIPVPLSPYRIYTVLHVREFPGFEGGAI